jgi:hypothetical protein
MSDAEEALAFQLRAMGISFQREVPIAPPRRWRADFVIRTLHCTQPECHTFLNDPLLVEVDGGSWTGGRHTTGTGFEHDCLKLNEAVIRGYRVLRVTPRMVEDGRALQLIERALAS